MDVFNRKYSGKSNSFSGSFTKRFFLSLAFAIFILSGINSFAATWTWTGAVSTNWNTAGNWSPALVPSSGNDVVINGGAFAPTVPSSGVIVSNLSFSASGVLNFASNAVLTVKAVTSINNGGTINLGNGQVTCTGNVRIYNTGTFNAGSGFITDLGSTWQVDSGSAFNCGTSTVYFNGASRQTLKGTAGTITFYDVIFGSGGKDTSRVSVHVLHNAVIENGSTLSTGQKDFTVEGDLVNNGTAPVGNPYIVDAITPALTIVEVTFDEAVSTNTANVAANYSITNTGYSVTAAARTSTNTAIVRLTVSPALTDGADYTLKVNNVEDSNGNVILANTLKYFTAASSAAAPTLTGISPTSVGVSSSVFTMTLTGSNFTPGSIVKFNGSSRETIYVNSTTLRAVITDSDLVSAGTFPITVFTAPPGGGTSGSQTFTVAAVNHAPTFTMGPDQSVLKNAGLQTVVSWASSISSGSSDGNQAPYTFILSNDNNALFSSQPAR